LLVGFIPGLLMMATFGLERLESGLTRDTVSATDVDEFLRQARADAAAPVHHRLGEDFHRSGLPTRLYVHHQPNPQVQATRHANRV
jgi:hypothetical protein